jgi:hypothetical protein
MLNKIYLIITIIKNICYDSIKYNKMNKNSRKGNKFLSIQNNLNSLNLNIQEGSICVKYAIMYLLNILALNVNLKLAQ